MNRPPGDGFPYDQPSPIPPEYGVPEPFARILCGYPLVSAEEPNGPILCANTAPCPLHRHKRVETAQARRERAAEEAEDLLQARKDERERAELEQQLNAAVPELPPAPTYHGITPHAPIPKYDPDSPLDLHDQLHPVAEEAWSVRSRLAKSLGRRALATRLADALPPLLGAELADRLDTLITQAVTETEAAITQALSDEYHQARERLDADAAAKLKELHDERYRRPSRLS